MNKGLTDKQHKFLSSLLIKEGAEIVFMDTEDFRQKEDFETLRKAVYDVFVNSEFASESMDEIMMEAMKYFDQRMDLDKSLYASILPKIYEKYDAYFEAGSTYSWAILSQAIHEKKKELYQQGKKELRINGEIIKQPEDFRKFLWPHSL